MNEEFARAGVPRVTRGMGEWLVGPSIIVHGTDEQKAYFLPRHRRRHRSLLPGLLRARRRIGPGRAEDARRRRRRRDRRSPARRCGPRARTVANMMFCLCRTDPDAPKHRGISYVLLPMKRPDGSSNGFELRPIRQITGNEQLHRDVHHRGARAAVQRDRRPAQRLARHDDDARQRAGRQRHDPARAVRAAVLATSSTRCGGCGRADDPLVRQQLAWAYTHVEIMRYAGPAHAVGGGRAQGARAGRVDQQDVLVGVRARSRRVGDEPARRGRDGAARTARATRSTAGRPTSSRSRSGTIWGGTAQVQRNIVGERVLGLPKEDRRRPMNVRRGVTAICDGRSRSSPARGEASGGATRSSSPGRARGRRERPRRLGRRHRRRPRARAAVVDEIRRGRRGDREHRRRLRLGRSGSAGRDAIETFGDLDVVVNNAGILRDRMLVNMTEAEWDAVIRVHLKGTFAPTRFAAAYWRERPKAGEPVDARVINTSSTSGLFANPGQTQLRRREVGDRDVLDHRGQGAGPVRRHRQRDRAGRAHPHDREPRRRSRPRRAGRVGRAGAREHRAARDVARERGVGRHHRSGVPRRRRSHRDRARLGTRSGCRPRRPMGSGGARCGRDRAARRRRNEIVMPRRYGRQS